MIPGATPARCRIILRKPS